MSISSRTIRLAVAIAAALTLSISVVAVEKRKPIKPGWNLFSPAQDIEMGKEAAAQVEKEVALVDDKQLAAYVEGIGRKLASRSQAPDYPYSFKVVAEDSINAFALPGGPIYIHSGLISVADNEAQVAGVMAHEVGHVALRHGTARVTKAYAFQIPLMIAGGALQKKGGIIGALAPLGLGFGVNSLMLKNSRGAEKQADIVGARMMAEAGYDAVEMARFFEKLEGERAKKPGFLEKMLSDHPSPGNRVEYVSEEVVGYGGRGVKTTPEFETMKRRAAAIKRPKAKEAEPSAVGTSATPSRGRPSRGAADASRIRYKTFRGADFRIIHPNTWKAYAAPNKESLTAVPADGLVEIQEGRPPALARGLLAGFFQSERSTVRAKTNELINDLRASNGELNAISGQRTSVRIDRKSGESVHFDGPSPLPNERELVWLITVDQPDGLFYALMVSAESDGAFFKPQFERIVDSIRLN